MPSILLVCTANICRSPMAQVILLASLPEDQEWRVESAGTWALEDMPPAANTQLVLEKRGLSAAQHRARSVSKELVEQFDLILVMEPGQKEALQVEFPQAAGRIYLVSEMIGLEYTIPDPFRKSLQDFEDTAAEFEAIFSQGMVNILQLTSKK